MKIAALTAALACLVATATSRSVTKAKSRYPEQYSAFKDTANQACKDLFKALDARRHREAEAAVRRLLSAKPPPDLRRRWQIFKSDVRRYFFAPKVVADRAAAALDDGADELGLDKC